MPTYPIVRLVSNFNQSTGHSSRLTQLFERAEHFDCYVAFANSNGLELLWEPLVGALEAGMKARFVVGLNFYQTEPQALYDLLEVSESYPRQLEFYISSGCSKLTFHPKVYAFRYPKENCRIVIGSANLTQGGLTRNIESSLLYEHTNSELATELEVGFLKLKKAGEIETATLATIEEYARRHRIYALHRKAAELRAQRACMQTQPAGTLPYLDDLAAILELMKADENENNFDRQVKKRSVTRPVALEILESIRKTRNLTKDRFLQLYEGLVVDHAWHSGSLHRRRKTVAESYGVFQVALQDLVRTLGPNTSAGDAYDTLLQHLSNASHVGPNIISEILHSYDSRRFAVMNQNSIAGIAMAGFTQFPTRPSKASVTPQLYEEFCDGAEIVRAGLGLNDFAELDALFNYAYW